MRIWDLYRNKKYNYLNRQLLLHKYIQPVHMGEVLKVNYDEIIIDVIYRPFSVLLVENQYDKKINQLRSILLDISQNHYDEIKS
ncbi:hypothetical protein CN380_21550 [Bacillus sp. AFS017274]|nr:hypothetical protein CN380_21550 [Bacillus sp. AFS017274]